MEPNGNSQFVVVETQGLRRDGKIVTFTLQCDCVTPFKAHEVYNQILQDGFAGRLVIELRTVVPPC